MVLICISLMAMMGFPDGSDSKESACNAGDLGSNPGLGRSPGGGNGNSVQYSCLKNPIDRGAWHAVVHRVTWLSKVIKQKMEQIDELVSKMF